MKSFLFCCLFGTFLATGMCLECEVCSGLGSKCTGWTRTCKDYEDTCVTVQSEVMLASVSLTFTGKTCGVSDTCDLDYLETTLHDEIRMRFKKSCCTGSECQTLPHPVLESQTHQASQPNGLQCPTCFAPTSVECIEHLVSCRASENQCLFLIGRHHDISRGMSFKGCVSQSVCTLLKKKSWTLYEELELEVKCSPALPQSSH
ncbi:phospholipase A2 inhibitor subunit gamma B-like [Thamnophis elegans]|uniref:phospholipase A2 inhibitor subunit gamma B-like n=1 Tax=Thamnophis elegans TaxID=35005 RepID=UPI001376CAD0|nr:phospholipase A2 inhibitor subunit gamma B-like [Thamnophis elegans]XP_032083704.1 phospholipase A2 inhibitor subunit gamma B-like [Thamnophis elegans]XP_032083705.1 phospholipase A2 inhibitor subunit gamma B-like [Thamnophis elegans]